VTASPASTRRIATALALTAAAALTLSACGSGKIAQTANQVAAINGNGANVANISMRNVHVAYPNSEEYSLTEGGKAELIFTAVNTSEQFSDTLRGIETEGAEQVTLVGTPGSIEIPAQAALAAGVPADQEPLDPEEPSSSVLVELDGLSADVRPGLTVPMTFKFERAGDVVVNVPVDAGPTPRVVNEQSGPATEEG
jgi:copper(I)-binding protein